MASQQPSDDWTSSSLKTSDLILDRENPRIPILPNESQENIRRKLLETMDVIDLAKEIIESKGLLAGERIIACVENGKYVVLEGNRRTTACQLLLNPNLIPKDFLGKFPSAPSDVIAKIQRINADVAPNRVSAEITITKKHTKNSALRWTPEAQHRRIKRMIEAGRSIDEIKALFGLKTAELVTRIREGELLAAARSLPGWKPKEKIILHEARLKTNAFTRFFTLKGVRNALGLSFDANGVLIFDNKTKSRARIAMKNIAREFLIPTAKGSPAGNTRTTPTELFAKLERQDPLLRGLAQDLKKAIAEPAKKKSPNSSPPPSSDKPPGINPPPSSPPPSSPPPSPTPKKVVFFQSLQCHINDHRLISVTSEINSIDYLQFPIAASFLARSLLESGLNWCIKEKRQNSGYKKYCQDKNTKAGLQAMIRFCAIEANATLIFSDVGGVKRTLNQWLGTHKDYCDLIVHGEWLNPSQSGLDSLAADTLPLIQRILDGTILA